MDVDDIKEIGEEEYTIVNLDSRDMIYNGAQWLIKNKEGKAGLNEFIPYVTSIEVAESFIPDTLYNIDSRNKISYGFILETYELNRDTQGAPAFYTEEHIKNTVPYLKDDGNIEYPDYVSGNIDYDVYGREFVKNIPSTPKTYYTGINNRATEYCICHSRETIIENGKEIGTKLTFKVNKENIDIKNELREFGISKRLIKIYSSDGSIDTNAIIEITGTIDEFDNIVNDRHVSYDFSIYKESIDANISDFIHTFDYVSTLDNTDILPEGTIIDVYLYSTIEFEQKDYDITKFIETTNKDINNMLEIHLLRSESSINNYISYEIYKNMNLTIEYDEDLKKLEFISYYNYKFFVDTRSTDSLTYILGMENGLYFSHEIEHEYVEDLSKDDTISSFTKNNIEKYYASVPSGNDLTIYQLFQSRFMNNNIKNYKSDKGIIGSNFINNVASDVIPNYVNNYNFSKRQVNKDTSTNSFTSDSPSYIFDIMRDTSDRDGYSTIFYIGVRTSVSDYVFYTKPSLYNIANVVDYDNNIHNGFVDVIRVNGEIGNIFYILNSIFNDDKYTNTDLDNRTFVDNVVFKIKVNKISPPNIVNFSGNRYVDLTCIEIENELKRYNPEMNKLYRYYLEDKTDLYVTSAKGNIGDIVLQNPREFNPISRLSTLTLEFRKADGNIYDFKNIPFFISLVIKYLKPTLSIERLEN
jgi:hypothetical protein